MTEEMNRTVYVERLYSLGDFKNIKFSSALTGIPEGLAKNDKIVALLFLQSALSCEIAYRRYFDTVDRISKEKITNVLRYLEDERTKTYYELYQEIQQVGAEEGWEVPSKENEKKLEDEKETV